MSLLTEIKDYMSYPRYPDILSAVPNADFIEDEIVDHTRWYVVHEAVYARGDEYVMIRYEEPATEEGDYSEGMEPEVFRVEPVETTTVVWSKA